MNNKEQLSRWAWRLVSMIVCGMAIFSATPSFAGSGGKELLALETPVPMHCTIRVGSVDYGLEETVIDEPDLNFIPFSIFQKRLLLALANRKGLLVDFIGAAEAKAFENFLEDFKHQEKSYETQYDKEFGMRKPLESEVFKHYDLQELIDEKSWDACDYEIVIKVSDWSIDGYSTVGHLNGQSYSVDSKIERANVLLDLVELDTGRTMFSMFYKLAGEDAEIAFDEVARDYSVMLEIAMWKQWLGQNDKWSEYLTRD